MTSNDLLKKIKQAEKSLKDCVGSACMDEAGVCTSLMVYVRVKEAEWKQRAYALFVTEMARGESAAKSEALMKSSDEYKTYLILKASGESLMEMIRTMRAKGKNDKSEELLT